MTEVGIPVIVGGQKNRLNMTRIAVFLCAHRILGWTFRGKTLKRASNYEKTKNVTPLAANLLAFIRDKG